MRLRESTQLVFVLSARASFYEYSQKFTQAHTSEVTIARAFPGEEKNVLIPGEKCGTQNADVSVNGLAAFESEQPLGEGFSPPRLPDLQNHFPKVFSFG